MALTPRADEPRDFGGVGVVQILARDRELVFVTDSGEQFSIAVGENGLRRTLSTPRFVIDVLETRHGVRLYEAALDDGEVVDELEVREGTAPDGTPMETYVLNGELRTFVRDGSAQTDEEFRHWAEQELGRTQLSTERNPAARELLGFVRSHRVAITATLAFAHLSGDAGAIADAREMVRPLLEQGEDVSDELFDWMCGVAATCGLLKCTFSSILNPGCGLCTAVGLPCVVEWWNQRWPDVRQAAEELVDDLWDLWNDLFKAGS